MGVDPKTGDRKLKLEPHFCGESEGLDLFSGLGGRLHWIIAPSDDSGCTLTYGPTSALLHFQRSPGRQRYDVKVLDVEGTDPSETIVAVKVTRDGGRPVKGARSDSPASALPRDGLPAGSPRSRPTSPRRDGSRRSQSRASAMACSRTVTIGNPGPAAPASMPNRG